MGQINAVSAVNDMRTLDLMVGRGSRTSQGYREGTAFCTSLTCVTPLRSPSRAQRVANTHNHRGTLQTTARPPSRPKTSLDLTRHKPCETAGSFGSLALPPSRPKTSLDLTRHKPCETDGLFGSLALPPSRPKTSLSLTRHKPCQTDGSFGSLALPPSRPKTSLDLTRHKPCETAGSFGSLALPLRHQLK